MIADIRKQFNQSFTNEKYQQLLDTVTKKFNHTPSFRIAETPVFIPKDLKQKLFEACEEITDVLCQPNFKELSQGAILQDQFVPGENDHTIFLQMDFGICKDENGGLTPQLIEVQGFPSLYFFQDMVAHIYKDTFGIPDHYNHLFGGISSDEYIETLRRMIVGTGDPKNTILLEVEPTKQTTQIDFWAAEAAIGIKTCCISDLKVEGKDVYYLDKNGKKIGVDRVFNRVIFDELINRKDLKREFFFTKEANVHWVGHPHWFNRISKHTLPFLKSQYVPETCFLSELDKIPDDLENYVLKPLYSFAGTGVIINLNRYDIEMIEDKDNYILQRKVEYAPVVETLDSPAKCEIRMLMLWEEGHARPVIVNNLARLSKGEMIGVRYNKNKDWVGGSVGLFES